MGFGPLAGKIVEPVMMGHQAGLDPEPMVLVELECKSGHETLSGPSWVHISQAQIDCHMSMQRIEAWSCQAHQTIELYKETSWQGKMPKGREYATPNAEAVEVTIYYGTCEVTTYTYSTCGPIFYFYFLWFAIAPTPRIKLFQIKKKYPISF